MNTVESIRQVLISGIMTTVIHSEHLHRKDLPEVVAAAVHLQKQMMNRIVHREIHRRATAHRVPGARRRQGLRPGPRGARVLDPAPASEAA